MARAKIGEFERIEAERHVREGFLPKLARFAANLPFADAGARRLLLRLRP